MKVIFYSVILLSIIACTDSDVNNDEYRIAIEQSYSQWNGLGVNSYIFQYEETGFSPLNGIWEIQVENGVVIYVNYLGTDSPEYLLNIDTAPTIESLYERINDGCLNIDNCEIRELVFDQEEYFPVIYYESTGEEGWGFNITEFIAL